MPPPKESEFIEQKTIQVYETEKEILTGLKTPQKYISSKFFYDAEGSRIFQDIMKMPEYYLTDCEEEVFLNHKSRIGHLFCRDCCSVDLVELGAGDGQKTRIKLQPYLKASSGEYLLDAAVEGHGLVLLPTFIAHREIERGSLVTLFDDYQFPQLNAYAIYPQTRHLSQRVRSFVDFLVERFSGTPYWDQY